MFPIQLSPPLPPSPPVAVPAAAVALPPCPPCPPVPSHDKPPDPPLPPSASPPITSPVVTLTGPAPAGDCVVMLVMLLSSTAIA